MTFSRIVPLLLLLTTQTGVYAQTCDPDFVKALRSSYTEASGGSLKDILFELACIKSVQSKSTDASGNAIGYGDASYNESSKTIKEACAQSDKQFFEENSRQITSVFLPPQAIDLLKGCFPENNAGLSLTTTINYPQVLVTARWVDTTNGKIPKATIKSFHQSGAVSCDRVLKPTMEIGMATTTCNFTSSGGSASFVINTDVGSAYATVNPSSTSDANAIKRGVVPAVVYNIMQTAPGYLFQPNTVSKHTIAIPAQMKELVSVITWHCVSNCEAGKQFGELVVRKHGRNAIELTGSGKDGSATMGIGIDVEYR